MFGWASSWRKLRPEAVPRQIIALFCQSRGTHLLFEPVKKGKFNYEDNNCFQNWKVLNGPFNLDNDDIEVQIT